MLVNAAIGVVVGLLCLLLFLLLPWLAALLGLAIRGLWWATKWGLLAAGFAVVVVVLSGCTTAEERLAKHQAECAALGFTPATDPYRQCLLELRLAEAQRLNNLIQTQTYINSLP